MRAYRSITRNGNATTTYRIRVVPLEGNPWFVARDVLFVLHDSVKAGASHYLGFLGADEKRLVLKSNVHPMYDSFPNRGAQCISESGLYKLIMRSDKPQARAFQEWVTREVLPAIRKTGGYVLQGADRATVGEGHGSGDA